MLPEEKLPVLEVKRKLCSKKLYSSKSIFLLQFTKIGNRQIEDKSGGAKTIEIMLRFKVFITNTLQIKIVV